MLSPGFKPRTSGIPAQRSNHYTTKTCKEERSAFQLSQIVNC
ncbi:hypothetical protein X975_17284, partial [Stegodyphus mimosarum]